MDDNNDEIILNQLNSLPPSKELLQQYQVEKDQKKIYIELYIYQP